MSRIFKYVSLIGILLLGLLLFLMYSRPKYQNIFEEIYHDEYNYARGSWRSPTASTLERLLDMEKKATRGLLYGVTGEGYKRNSLPKNIDGIFYTFSYPDNELENGHVAIVINVDFPNSDILQVEYMYQHQSNQHQSNQLIQKIRIFSDDYKKEYPVEQYITQNKSAVEVYTEIANDILKNKLISDWLSVYPSQFSAENWGNVKMISENAMD